MFIGTLAFVPTGPNEASVISCYKNIAIARMFYRTVVQTVDESLSLDLASFVGFTSAEQRYAAIEGEALAVVWGLEKTKYFTLGCDNLIVVTDHKPLTKIFGDRTLEEIKNTRLFRLKQRTLPWFFKIVHLPGSSNAATDAASRHPSPSNPVQDDELTVGELVETGFIASIRRDTETLYITWDQLMQETSKEADMNALLQTIRKDFPADDRHVSHAAPYSRCRDNLY